MRQGAKLAQLLARAFIRDVGSLFGFSMTTGEEDADAASKNGRYDDETDSSDDLHRLGLYEVDASETTNGQQPKWEDPWLRHGFLNMPLGDVGAHRLMPYTTRLREYIEALETEEALERQRHVVRQAREASAREASAHPATA